MSASGRGLGDGLRMANHWSQGFFWGVLVGAGTIISAVFVWKFL